MVNHRTMVASLMRISWLCLLVMQQISVTLQRRRFRRWWERPHLGKEMRRRYGAYGTIFQYFKLYDEEEFYSFTGMPLPQFKKLFKLVKRRLTRHSRRTPLPPELKLAAVLNYLVHRTSPRKVAWFYRIGRSTMYKIIPEVCEAICESLMPHYLKFPSNHREWAKVTEGFLQKFGFPNCLGALDGKHFRIRRPPHSGALFYNFKKFYSVNLLAVCDSDGYFIWAASGFPGSVNDTTAFRSSNLGAALYSNQLPIIHQRRELPNTNAEMSHFFIGDGGFPLEEFLMKPYPTVREMPLERRIFNIRLGTARRVIERAFGRLTRKFKVFETPLDFNLRTIDHIIMSTVCLHNFLIRENQDIPENGHRYDDNSNDESTSGSDWDDGGDSSSESYSSAGSDSSTQSHSTIDENSASDSESASASDSAAENESATESEPTTAAASVAESQSTSDTDCEMASEVDISSDDDDARMAVYDDTNYSDGEGRDVISSNTSGQESSEGEGDDPLEVDDRGRTIREMLNQYFITWTGNVDWQWRML